MFALQEPTNPTALTMAAGWVALGLIALLGLAVLYYVFTERIDLSRLLSEPNGDASISRFQLLIFTFVIAASLFLVIASAKPPSFPKTDIPPGVLILLGISSSSYLVSKGIQFSSPEGVIDRGPEIKVSGITDTTTAGGKTIQFTATVLRLANTGVAWSLEPPTGMGTIDANGLYTPPQAPAAGAPKPTGTVAVRATSVEDKTLTDVATVTLT